MTVRSTAAVLLTAAAFCGCTRGFIYTDVVEPLTLDMNQTRVHPGTARSSRVSLKEPFSGLGLRAEWSGYAIGAAAREAGLQTVHYADIRQQSLLGGLWERTMVLVYGSSRAEHDADAAVLKTRPAAEPDS